MNKERGIRIPSLLLLIALISLVIGPSVVYALEFCPIDKIPTTITIDHSRHPRNIALGVITNTIEIDIGLTARDPNTGEKIALPEREILLEISVTDKFVVRQGQGFALSEEQSPFIAVTSENGMIQLIIPIDPPLFSSSVDPRKISYAIVASFVPEPKEPLIGSFESVKYTPGSIPLISLASCMPLLLVLGLLTAATYASGKNPFGFFDFTRVAFRAPRIRRRAVKVRRIIIPTFGLRKLRARIKGGLSARLKHRLFELGEKGAKLDSGGAKGKFGRVFRLAGRVLGRAAIRVTGERMSKEEKKQLLRMKVGGQLIPTGTKVSDRLTAGSQRMGRKAPSAGGRLIPKNPFKALLKHMIKEGIDISLFTGSSGYSGMWSVSSAGTATIAGASFARFMNQLSYKDRAGILSDALDKLSLSEEDKAKYITRTEGFDEKTKQNLYGYSLTKEGRKLIDRKGITSRMKKLIGLQAGFSSYSFLNGLMANKHIQKAELSREEVKGLLDGKNKKLLRNFKKKIGVKARVALVFGVSNYEKWLDLNIDALGNFSMSATNLTTEADKLGLSLTGNKDAIIVDFIAKLAILGEGRGEALVEAYKSGDHKTFEEIIKSLNESDKHYIRSKMGQIAYLESVPTFLELDLTRGWVSSKGARERAFEAAAGDNPMEYFAKQSLIQGKYLNKAGDQRKLNDALDTLSDVRKSLQSNPSVAERLRITVKLNTTKVFGASLNTYFEKAKKMYGIAANVNYLVEDARTEVKERTGRDWKGGSIEDLYYHGVVNDKAGDLYMAREIDKKWTSTRLGTDAASEKILKKLGQFMPTEPGANDIERAEATKENARLAKRELSSRLEQLRKEPQSKERKTSIATYTEAYENIGEQLSKFNHANKDLDRLRIKTRDGDYDYVSGVREFNKVVGIGGGAVAVKKAVETLNTGIGTDVSVAVVRNVYQGIRIRPNNVGGLTNHVTKEEESYLRRANNTERAAFINRLTQLADGQGGTRPFKEIEKLYKVASKRAKPKLKLKPRKLEPAFKELGELLDKSPLPDRSHDLIASDLSAGASISGEDLRKERRKKFKPPSKLVEKKRSKEAKS